MTDWKDRPPDPITGRIPLETAAGKLMHPDAIKAVWGEFLDPFSSRSGAAEMILRGDPRAKEPEGAIRG